MDVEHVRIGVPVSDVEEGERGRGDHSAVEIKSGSGSAGGSVGNAPCVSAMVVEVELIRSAATGIGSGGRGLESQCVCGSGSGQTENYQQGKTEGDLVHDFFSMS